MTIKAWAEITIAHIIDPPTIVGTVTRYQISGDSVIVPGGLWYTEKPDVPDGSYLWIYTNAVYSDGTQLETHSVSKVGLNGDPTYTWVKYADTETGSGMSDFPEGKRYVGMAFNKATATGSNVAADYSWSPLYDNVDVGGRNLLRNTGYIDGLAGTRNRGTTHTISVDTANRYNNNNSLKIIASAASVSGVHDVWQFLWDPITVVGKTSTVSFYIKGSVATTAWIRYGGNGPTTPKSFVVTKDWTLVTVTFDPVTQTGNAETEMIYGFAAAGTYYVNSMKLEYGNIATDWTPAPEDVQGQIDNVVTRVITAETSLDMTKEAITLKADKTVTDGLTTRVSNAESKITAEAISQTVRSSAAYINDLAGKANASSLANYSTLTQTAESIRAEVGKVQIGGTNIPLNSAFQTGDFEGWDSRSPEWSVLTTVTHPNEMLGYNMAYCSLTGAPSTSTSDLWTKEYFILPGDYTLSCHVEGSVTALIIGIGSDGNWTFYKEVPFSGPWTPTHYKATFTLPPDAVKMRVIFRQSGGNSCVLSLIKLESGTKATAWSASPFDAAGSVSATAVKIDNKDGLRVDQKLSGRNIPSYFKANAQQFGMYNTADNTPFFEAGVDGGGNGYSATTRLKDVRKASNFYASIEPNTIIGNWQGGALALHYDDKPLLSIAGLYGGWPGQADAYIQAKGEGARLNLQADGAQMVIRGSGVNFNRPLSFESVNNAWQTIESLGAFGAGALNSYPASNDCNLVGEPGAYRRTDWVNRPPQAPDSQGTLIVYPYHGTAYCHQYFYSPHWAIAFCRNSINGTWGAWRTTASSLSILSGATTITMKPSTAEYAVRVVFPFGGFVMTPIVVCSLSFVSNAVSSNNSVFPVDISPEGFTIYYGHEASNTATVPVQWIAMQPT